MASRIYVEFNRLPEISAQMEARASQAVAKAAFDVEARAKAVVPVDTGNLRSSIQTETNVLQATVSVGADYGIYVELGTRFMGAQPFMTPAAEIVRPQFIEAMRQLVEQGW